MKNGYYLRSVKSSTFTNLTFQNLTDRQAWMLNFKMFSFSLIVMMTLARCFNFNPKRYLQKIQICVSTYWFNVRRQHNQMSTDKISSDWTWVDRTSFEGKRRWGEKKQAIVEEKTYQRHCRNMRRSFQDAGAISKVGAQKILIASCLPK